MSVVDVAERSAELVLYSNDAEGAVVGSMLANPKIVGQVVSSKLEGGHFYRPHFAALYEQVVTAYYADDPIDPVTIGEPIRRQLASAFNCDESEAVGRLRAAVMSYSGASPAAALKHVAVVRRHADRRALLTMTYRVQRALAEDDGDPVGLAAEASEEAMRIATATLLTDELMTFEDLGRAFVRRQRALMEARKQGIEIGAYFGLNFIDKALRGLRPGELWFLAGEPGAGKSAVSWRAAQGFSERQAKIPKERQVATLVASLEMGEEPSSHRWAMAISNIDGGALREGRNTDAELSHIVDEWKKRRDLPLILNHSSTMRLTQLRAMVVEAVRRHNVGFVLIDHWKYLETDRRYNNPFDEDEAKARFLKQDLAKQLNVAVLCLAHTTKNPSGEDFRPRMSDLRGSGYVAAHADFISFVHRPYKYATQDQLDDGEVSRTDAEMLWEKARHSVDGTSLPFYFDPSKMVIY